MTSIHYASFGPIDNSAIMRLDIGTEYLLMLDFIITLIVDRSFNWKEVIILLTISPLPFKLYCPDSVLTKHIKLFRVVKYE